MDVLVQLTSLLSFRFSSKWRNKIQTKTFKNNTYCYSELEHCCLFLYGSRWAILTFKRTFETYIQYDVKCRKMNCVRKCMNVILIIRAKTTTHVKHSLRWIRREKNWSIHFSDFCCCCCLRPHSYPHGSIQSDVKVCASLNSLRSCDTQNIYYFCSDSPTLSLIHRVLYCTIVSANRAIAFFICDEEKYKIDYVYFFLNHHHMWMWVCVNEVKKRKYEAGWSEEKRVSHLYTFHFYLHLSCRRALKCSIHNIGLSLSLRMTGMQAKTNSSAQIKQIN